MITTKQEILDYIKSKTEEFQIEDFNVFSANNISDSISISRSLASQYSNELVKDGIFLKISSRPVYFLHKKVLERKFSTLLVEDEYIGTSELLAALSYTNLELHDFSKAIGKDGSLKTCIDQCKASLKYPPRGLPIMLCGKKGTGKELLCRLMFEYSINQRIIDNKMKLVFVDILEMDLTEDNFIAALFGSKTKNEISLGIIEQNQNGFVCIKNIGKLSVENLVKLQGFIETGTYSSLGSDKIKKSNTRLVFISEENPDTWFMQEFVHCIPVICQIPDLEERFADEKEEFIYLFLKEESKRMGKEIFVCDAAIRALIETEYSQDILGLMKTIQLICANANVDSDYSKENSIYIYMYHLPEYIITKNYIEENYFDELNFINVKEYKKTDDFSRIVELFDSILDCYKTIPFEETLNNTEQFITKSSNYIKQYYDYLVFEKKYSSSRLKLIERTISEILSNVLSIYGINIPVNFTVTTSRILYCVRENSSLMNGWMRKNNKELQLYLSQLNKFYPNECAITDRIELHIRNSIGIKMDEMNKLIFIMYLAYYNHEINQRKYLGIVVAHGFATASSIADAVNTLLGKYIFDAIDMPIDTTVNEIVDKIKQFIYRTTMKNELLILVDMGSLEDIGKQLIDVTSRDIGVINNVSTKSALVAGNLILRGYEMAEILEKVSSQSQSTYKIIENKRKRSVIIFIADNLKTARKMVDLFVHSLPKAIELDVIAYDYHDFTKYKEESKLKMNDEVLFISGVSNPFVMDTELFIPLEEIVSLDGLDRIYDDLKKFLTPYEIDLFKQNLMKNFSLQNVVSHLTILEPTKLMEFVTEAVESLQVNIKKNLSGKATIGMYIHMCSLIERLVTKDPIENENIDQFISTQQEFINIVQQSFTKISLHYGIVLPIGEIAYLYEYIKLDDMNHSGDKNWTI